MSGLTYEVCIEEAERLSLMAAQCSDPKYAFRLRDVSNDWRAQADALGKTAKGQQAASAVVDGPWGERHTA
jgi:hypothetical protein